MPAQSLLPLTIAETNQFVLASLIVLFVAVSFIMILVVLIQKPQGGGLSGAFGAAADGAGQTAFGAKTGDVLTLVTVGVFVVFLTIAGVLNLVIEPTLPPDESDTVQSSSPAPASTGGAGQPNTSIDLAVDADGNISEVNIDQPEPADDPAEDDDYTPLDQQPAPADPAPEDPQATEPAPDQPNPTDPGSDDGR